MSLKAAIAVTRFGLGARPGEIDEAAGNPQAWLLDQLAPEAAAAFPAAGLKSSKDHLIEFFDYQIVRRQARGNQPTDVDAEAAERFGRVIRMTLRAEVTARMTHGAVTRAPFHERVTRFWANHFTVSARRFQSAALAGAYEREAIRPNILGRFEDLAAAAIFHPGMLVYLDNWQSVGPDSTAGRRRDAGLNENLAREVLELHTVSPEAGYTQEDVTEFARALTGWSVGNDRIGQGNKGETVFLSLIHEPGARTVLGSRYGGNGKEQAPAILRDLCAHPKTARHIATRLARHFVSDTPPAALVEQLEAVFISTRGDLMALYETLVQAPQAWDYDQAKYKTPDELLTSTARLIGPQAALAGDPRDVLESFAQPPFGAPSPKGWPDSADAWIGPDSLTKRIEWAGQIADRQPGLDARRLLDTALGERLSAETLEAVSRAESGQQALVLALMSPEFQRR